MRHYASRGLLAVLSGFIAVTAIAGAIFVVPTLPPNGSTAASSLTTPSLPSPSASSGGWLSSR